MSHRAGSAIICPQEKSNLLRNSNSNFQQQFLRNAGSVIYKCHVLCKLFFRKALITSESLSTRSLTRGKVNTELLYMENATDRETVTLKYRKKERNKRKIGHRNVRQNYKHGSFVKHATRITMCFVRIINCDIWKQYFPVVVYIAFYRKIGYTISQLLPLRRSCFY